MKTKNLKTDNLVQVPESTLLALILSQLKGVVLFPEKVESAKKYLIHINKKAAFTRSSK